MVERNSEMKYLDVVSWGFFLVSKDPAMARVVGDRADIHATLGRGASLPALPPPPPPGGRGEAGDTTTAPASQVDICDPGQGLHHHKWL